MKKNCLIISDNDKFDLGLLEKLIKNKEFNYGVNVIITIYEIDEYNKKKLPDIKKYSLNDISLSYIKNFKNIIELDEEIINKNSNSQLDHAKGLTFVTPDNTFTLNELRDEYFSDLKFVLNLLEEFKPDTVFFFNIPHDPKTLVLSQLCINYKINQIVLRETLPATFVLEDAKRKPFDNNLKTINKTVLKHIIKDFISFKAFSNPLFQKFRNHTLVRNKIFSKNLIISFFIYFFYRFVSYVFHQFKNLIKTIIYIYIKTFKINIKINFNNPLFAYENWKKKKFKLADSKTNEFHFAHILFKEELKKFFYFRKYLKNCTKIAPNEKFIYFPLHFQPEATTIPYGNFFYDQIQAIKLLSSHLDNNIKIFVKEHPDTFNLARHAWTRGTWGRDRHYYDDLLKINNVQLLNLDSATDVVLDQCMFVATIAGTTALQSVLKNKPSLIFGDAWFRECEGVHLAKNAKDVIKFLDNKIYEKSVEKEKVDNFFNNLNLNSFEASKTGISLSNIDHEIQDASSIIIKRINEIENNII